MVLIQAHSQDFLKVIQCVRSALQEKHIPYCVSTCTPCTHKQQNCQLNEDVDKMSGDQEGQLVHGQAVVISCILLTEHRGWQKSIIASWHSVRGVDQHTNPHLPLLLPVIVQLMFTECMEAHIGMCSPYYIDPYFSN